MNLKNILLRKKLYIGFGIVLSVMFLVGIFSLINIIAINKAARTLENEYLSEISITIEIERGLAQTMLNMRGYGLTFNEAMYTEAMEYMDKTFEQAELANKLSHQTNELVILKKESDNLLEDLENYRATCKESDVVIKKNAELRKVMDESATTLVSKLFSFIEGFDKQMKNHISIGANRAGMMDQENMMGLITLVQNIVSEMRVKTWKAQATNNTTLFVEAAKSGEEIKSYFDLMKQLVKDEDMSTLNDIEKSMTNYVASVTQMAENWAILDQHNNLRMQIANSILESSQNATEAGKNGTKKITSLIVTSLTLSSIFLIIGLIIALGIGLFASITISNSITKPVNQSLEFANQIANGDYKAEYNINQEDEIGQLGKALKNMVDSFKTGVRILTKVSQGDLTGAEQIHKNADLKGEFDKAIQIMLSQLRNSVNMAVALSNGDLIEAETIAARSTSGELDQALYQMVEKLRHVVDSIVNGIDNILAASVQLSQSSQAISQGASEQAAATEEVSSSMEQMFANIQQNADNSQQTEKIAIHAVENITENHQASSIVVSSIKEIAEKISIIGEIAIQTNILALNAAVEAARAGVHGKGFAVVASEVKDLAERSKKAASEIDELSKSGVELAINSGYKLEELVPEIERTAQLVQEISTASIEQRSGADQINNAVQQLNQITQQNAAAAEEMATSAEQLNSQSEQMRQILAFFKIKNAAITTYNKKTSKTPLKNKISNKVKSIKSDDTSGIDLDMGDESLDKEFDKF
jgi:methyl-accepting chemotaxis protein